MIRGRLEEDDPLEAEAELIALWNQGLEITAMAQRLGIPKGTVQSRAHRLQARGLIQPRPKGGAYPRQKAQARSDGSPATPTPPMTPAPPVAHAPPALTFVAVPEIQELLRLVNDLHARVGALEQTRVPPALPAPPATTTPPVPPAAERKEIQQWTVRLSKALIEHLKAVGYERHIPRVNWSRSSYVKP
jgi:hypothetical protein